MKNEIAVIPDYTAEQFIDTEEPYAFLYQYRDNKFLLKQMVQKMKAKAGAVGVKCFISLWDAYQEIQAQKNGVMLANSTQFDGQEMELFSGEYICDENGVCVLDKFGYEINEAQQHCQTFLITSKPNTIYKDKVDLLITIPSEEKEKKVATFFSQFAFEYVFDLIFAFLYKNTIL